MESTQPAVKQLGEIALRVNDLEGMKQFYQEALELEVVREFATAVFLKIADGYEGHTQVLALFDRSTSVGQERTTLDHFALTISEDDYESERVRLEGLGLAVTQSEHAWIHWRSLYFDDPEGNQVELVCYDQSA